MLFSVPMVIKCGEVWEETFYCVDVVRSKLTKLLKLIFFFLIYLTVPLALISTGVAFRFAFISELFLESSPLTFSVTTHVSFDNRLKASLLNFCCIQACYKESFIFRTFN